MNNEMNFDPMTGKPINKDKNEVKETQISNTNQDQHNIQTIATVDQSNDKFLTNEQNNSTKKDNKLDEKSSYLFMIVLFVIILLVIIFVFPLLNKNM